MQVLEKILEEIDETIARYGENPYIDEKVTDLCYGLNLAKDIVRKHMNDSWIPVEKYGLPKDEGVYDLTIINGLEEYVSVRWQFLSGTHLSGTQHYVDGVHYWADNYRGDPINEFLSERVIAWRHIPESYRPERVEQVTEHKRLTTKEKYPHGAEGVSENKLTGRYCRGVFEATACIEKLAEYETAEEEGRLVVLPCDTVYFIWNKSSGISHVREKSILDLSLREILGIDKDGRYWSAKEEAEKALKEMEGK